MLEEQNKTAYAELKHTHKISIDSTIRIFYFQVEQCLLQDIK